MPVFQILRNSTAGTRPTGKLAGEPWVNHADKQFGVFDGTAAQDLLAIRFFSTTGTYAIGDYVIQAGGLYSCNTAVTVPGPFVPASWTSVGGAADLSAYLQLAGGTMVGPLLLAADPVADMEAATMGYVLDGDALRLPLTAGPTAPLTGELHLPAAAPTLPEVATNKAYVDAADVVLQDQIDILSGNLLFVGSVDAATDAADFTTSSGLADGPVPAAAVGNTGFYLICTVAGTPPAGNLPAEAFAVGDWAISDGTAWTRMPIGQAAVTASQVALSPAVGTYTDVQAAVTGLEAGKLALAGGTMTGVLTLAADPVGLMEPVTLGSMATMVFDAGVY